MKFFVSVLFILIVSAQEVPKNLGGLEYFLQRLADEDYQDYGPDPIYRNPLERYFDEKFFFDISPIKTYVEYLEKQRELIEKQEEEATAVPTTETSLTPPTDGTNLPSECPSKEQPIKGECQIQCIATEECRQFNATWVCCPCQGSWGQLTYSCVDLQSPTN